jgi:hypothetical protein
MPLLADVPGTKQARAEKAVEPGGFGSQPSRPGLKLGLTARRHPPGDGNRHRIRCGRAGGRCRYRILHYNDIPSVAEQPGPMWCAFVAPTLAHIPFGPTASVRQHAKSFGRLWHGKNGRAAITQHTGSKERDRRLCGQLVSSTSGPRRDPPIWEASAARCGGVRRGRFRRLFHGHRIGRGPTINARRSGSWSRRCRAARIAGAGGT